jgi:hypothetical protein
MGLHGLLQRYLYLFLLLLIRPLYCLCVYAPLPTTFEEPLEASIPKKEDLGEQR